MNDNNPTPAIPEEAKGQKAECAARKAGTPNGSYPQDCDWPFCGCDPKANKVIEAIEESGFRIVKPTPSAGGRQPEGRCAHPFVWPNGDCVECGVLATTMSGHTEPIHTMVPRKFEPLIKRLGVLPVAGAQAKCPKCGSEFIKYFIVDGERVKVRCAFCTKVFDIAKPDVRYFSQFFAAPVAQKEPE